MAVSQSGFVGELSNFILGAVFALVAGLIYNHKKTKGNAVIAGVAGAVAMAVVSLPCNYFVIYPLYYSVLGFPEEAVFGMYQALLPSVKNMVQALQTVSRGKVGAVRIPAVWSAAGAACKRAAAFCFRPYITHRPCQKCGNV